MHYIILLVQSEKRPAVEKKKKEKKTKILGRTNLVFLSKNIYMDLI